MDCYCIPFTILEVLSSLRYYYSNNDPIKSVEAHTALETLTLAVNQCT